MSFLAFDMDQELMFLKMNNKQSMCLLQKCILSSQTKCCYSATVSHQSVLLKASQQQTYGRFIIYHTSFSSDDCNFIYSKN